MLRSAGTGRQCLIRWTRQVSTTTTSTPRPRGRPRKVAVVESNEATSINALNTADTNIKSHKDGGQATTAVAPRRRGRPPGSTNHATGLLKSRKSCQLGLTQNEPPRVALMSSSQNHHDLASFLEHASRNELKTTTSVYKGTHYEYTVAEVLKGYSFALQRIGRANDLGIDLLGIWQLPQEPCELKVLIQCKVAKPSPSMVRELEGAYVGAPAGWRGADVMGMLVSTHPTTAGVRESLQRSRLPLCYAQITASGEVLQFLWNSAAKDARLTGMSATTTYTPTSANKTSRKNPVPSAQGIVSLLWLGKPWRGNTTASSSLRGLLCQPGQNTATVTTQPG
jgi:hypothetical protein